MILSVHIANGARMCFWKTMW